MKTKRLNSCFICDVEINDKYIILIDSVKKCFYIDRANCSKDTLNSFESWFKNVFMKAIAQTITIVDYDIIENADNEAMMIVNKLIYNKPINESENK